MIIYQRDRVFELDVGTGEKTVRINNNLNISFKSVKSSNNKDRKSEAEISIYNLSKENRALLQEPYVRVRLRVGWASSDLHTLFVGQVANISTSKIGNFLTNREGTDLITTLMITELYEELNNTVVSSLVPAGKTVRDAILDVARRLPEVTRHEIGGRAVGMVLPDGYPAVGTPRQLLDRMSREFNIEWQIDEGVLYVADLGKVYSDNKEKAFKIGQFSGMKGRPEFINEDAKRFRRKAQAAEEGVEPPKEKVQRGNALRVTILLNPLIKAGSIVYLEFEDLTGYYKVDIVEHSGEYRGNDWYSTITLSEGWDG